MAEKKIKIREDDHTIYECKLEPETENKKVPVFKYIVITVVVIALSILIGFGLSLL